MHLAMRSSWSRFASRLEDAPVKPAKAVVAAPMVFIEKIRRANHTENKTE